LMFILVGAGSMVGVLRGGLWTMVVIRCGVNLIVITIRRPWACRAVPGDPTTRYPEAAMPDVGLLRGVAGAAAPASFCRFVVAQRCLNV